MTGDLRIAVLGPLEVWRGGVQVQLGPNRLRTMLAVLAMSARETVSTDQLAVAMWAHDPPANQRRSVQTYIARLRHALGPASISTSAVGYRLEVEPGLVDALRFRRLLNEARRSRGTPAERGLLDGALALWRGGAFDGIESEVLSGPEASHLVELRLSAVERWIDLGLAEGRHAEMVAEIQYLADGHPLREPLWGRLLRTLGRCGRQAEALAVYERLRRRIADDLGVAPSSELQRIHLSLLRGGMGAPEPPSSRTERFVATAHLR
ncbi:AfsR/SARP family transcriptional regulator [Nonomuraea sp. PA05]|uniref:AfsR/SARP family transcriptional regulator n=1 Tax=Nonomuraea sp. PA05 TaxID=2604466 RepID=UPI0011D3EF80|nr:AfsR/SARP family transcriptional regulator [Nonomuraea sp. PA05]TYB56994.1 AfsR/SARP family transcriptional regulator [Nonomuraea sp. PA05]